MATWPTFPVQGTRLVSAFRQDFNDVVDALVTCFVGTTAPTTTYACMLWADTSEGKLKQRNVANTAWIVRGALETAYGGALPLSGGTMTGAIDMGGNAITNLPVGSGNAPARYSDLSSYVKTDGSVAFSGWPSLPTGSPTSDYKAAHKKYVDDTSKAGGTFTGQISMSVAPSSSNHVMRKTDVETIRDTHTHSGVAGYGSKIPGTSLSSVGQSAGMMLKSDGANGVAWGDIKAQGWVFNTSLVQVANLSTSGSWQVVDLAAYVTTDTVAAVFLCNASSGGALWDIRFRLFGSVGSGVYSGLGWSTLAPVSSRKVEVQAIRVSGSGTLEVKLWAYVRQYAGT